MTVPPYVCGAVGLFIFAWSSDKRFVHRHQHPWRQTVLLETRVKTADTLIEWNADIISLSAFASECLVSS